MFLSHSSLGISLNSKCFSEKEGYVQVRFTWYCHCLFQGLIRRHVNSCHLLSSPSSRIVIIAVESWLTRGHARCSAHFLGMDGIRRLQQQQAAVVDPSGGIGSLA